MIIGIFHNGSGLGNQLHRYIATRIKALEENTSFAMIGDFKGKDFMNLQTYEVEYPAGKIITDTPTIIDGEFQAESVWKKHIDKVREWLRVEPLDMPDDLCVIGFRGGEYVGVGSLFLPQSYWNEAIKIMKDKYPDIRFEVHTDDVATAKRFFPDYECIHDMALNWRSVRYAKHLIIANSSFFIFPSLLGDAVEIIAPEYWAGYNVFEWSTIDNKYVRFTYI